MIDKNEIDRARSTDVVDFLSRYKGFNFKGTNGIYRCKEHPSLTAKSDRLSWYWHSKSVGGYGVFDFLMKIENLDFNTALSVVNGTATIVATPIVTTTAKELLFPEKANSYRRIFAYLCKTRGVDSKLIERLIQEKKLYEDTKGNAVFVGVDEQGKPRYATLRGTYTDNPFRMDCVGSDKRYSFCMGALQAVYTYLKAP